ncbi:MAG: site-specific DNA-methyltransferase, partial [Aureispira sp.]|nr:site-specific DNA-methyltransferase [Aureispira sp.]
MIELLNMDCMDYLKECDDNAFQLCIVDPPYGIGEDGSSNKSRSKLAAAKNYKPYIGNDKKPPDLQYFQELKRVSKNQIIWGANHFCGIFGGSSSCWIVWDKVNGKNDFADCELAYTSFETATRMFKYTWHGMLQGDMKNKEHRIHANQKPVKLYEWLLTNYAKEGDRILDTHGGSMSSAIACHNLNYNMTIIELDDDYFRAGKERLESHQ